MNLRNVLTMLAAAAVTAAATLALLAPRGDAQAGPTVRPIIAQPKFTSHDCTFALKTDKASYEAGETPAVEVTAVNPTDKPLTVSVWASASATRPVSPMSRMLPIPVTFWSHEYAFTLPPGGTQSLTASCAALPGGKSIAILLGDQQNAVMAGDIGIPPTVQNTNNIPQNAIMPGGVQPNAAPAQAAKP